MNYQGGLLTNDGRHYQLSVIDQSPDWDTPAFYQ